MRTSRRRAIGLIAAGLLAASGCQSTPQGEPEAPEASEPEAQQEGEEPSPGAVEDTVTDRDVLIPALEAGLEKENAKASWSGDVLTIALDGDVDDEAKRFQHCRVVGHFLEDGDTLILQYPNGSIDCADISELEGQLIW